MNSFSLEQLAYLGDIISGLVVATTLVVLVFEMSSGNRRLRSEALRETINDFIRSYAQATSVPEKASNFRDGLNNFFEMKPDEQAQFHSTMLNLTGGFNQVQSLYSKGLIEKQTFDGAKRVYLTTMRTRGAKQWWSAFKHIPPEPLVQYVDEAVIDSNIQIRPATDDLPWLKEQG